VILPKERWRAAAKADHSGLDTLPKKRGISRA